MVSVYYHKPSFMKVYLIHYPDTIKVKYCFQSPCRRHIRGFLVSAFVLTMQVAQGCAHSDGFDFSFMRHLVLAPRSQPLTQGSPCIQNFRFASNFHLKNHKTFIWNIWKHLSKNHKTFNSYMKLSSEKSQKLSIQIKTAIQKPQNFQMKNPKTFMSYSKSLVFFLKVNVFSFTAAAMTTSLVPATAPVRHVAVGVACGHITAPWWLGLRS